MEFAIEREEFIRGLSRVQSIIEKRTTLPILSNVLLETKENGLQIVGTDLEVGIKGLFTAEIKDPGSITVPAKKLFEIIRELPEGEVLFKVVENDWVTINAGQAHFKLMGLVPDDFPILPDYEEETFFKLPTETLAELIEMVGHAIGSDETRPYLNGLFIHTVENGGKNFLRTVATDGHRLALSERELPEGEKIKVQPGVIIPKKGISELKKALDGDGDNILIAFTERNTIIKTDNTLFIIRLIDGGGLSAPDYRIYDTKGRWIVENEGVEPDIVVDNKPEEMAKGYDAQLRTAVDMLLKDIKFNPITWPAHEPFPVDK